jgi:hypothetical protein
MLLIRTPIIGLWSDRQRDQRKVRDQAAKQGSHPKDRQEQVRALRTRSHVAVSTPQHCSAILHLSRQRALVYPFFSNVDRGWLKANRFSTLNINSHIIIILNSKTDYVLEYAGHGELLTHIRKVSHHAFFFIINLELFSAHIRHSYSNIMIILILICLY